MPLIAQDLVKVYDQRRVVDEVSLRVDRGEIVGLLGPNGAGKTTTFYMIMGAIQPEAGTVTMDGISLNGMPMHRRAREGIGYLAQQPSVFRKITVRENLLLILQMQGMEPEAQQERADELLCKLGIASLAESSAAVLSGGERRRVEIARALCTSPAFILLDEPFTGVDPIAIEEIQSIVTDLQDDDIGILITDHNVRETLGITHRAYIIFEGKIRVEGDADEIVDDSQARKYYLGEKFRM